MFLLQLCNFLNSKFYQFPYNSLLKFKEELPLIESQAMIYNDTIDIIALGHQKTEVREENFAFTKSLFLVKTRLLRRNFDGHMEQMFSFFQTYDKHVWMTFLLMWIVQWLFCVVAQKIEMRGKRVKRVGLVDVSFFK